MSRIEPHFIPPTISRGSGLTRQHVDGRVEGPPDSLYGDEPKGRYLLALLVVMVITVVLGVAGARGL